MIRVVRVWRNGKCIEEYAYEGTWDDAMAEVVEVWGCWEEALLMASLADDTL